MDQYPNHLKTKLEFLEKQVDRYIDVLTAPFPGSGALNLNQEIEKAEEAWGSLLKRVAFHESVGEPSYKERVKLIHDDLLNSVERVVILSKMK